MDKTNLRCELFNTLMYERLFCVATENTDIWDKMSNNNTKVFDDIKKCYEDNKIVIGYIIDDIVISKKSYSDIDFKNDIIFCYSILYALPFYFKDKNDDTLEKMMMVSLEIITFINKGTICFDLKKYCDETPPFYKKHFYKILTTTVVLTVAGFIGYKKCPFILDKLN